MFRKNLSHIEIGLIGLWLMLPLIASLAIWAGWNRYKGTYWYDPADFAKTEGTVITAAILPVKVKGKTSYRYSIKYQYSIDRKNYISDVVNFANDVRDALDLAEDYVNKYPVGTKITVYYDQKDPDFSVLEPEKNDNGQILYLLILLGTFFLGGAIYFLWKGIVIIPPRLP